MSNKTVIRRIVEEIFNQDRLDLIEELIAPDYIDHAALPGQAAGRETVRETAIRYREAFPDLQWIIDDLIVEGETAALRWSARGTHLGAYSGIPASGRRIVFSGMSFYHLRDGQVTDEWVCWDEAGILKQISALPE